MDRQTLLITGILGYVATEIVEFYIGNPKYKIIGIDNRFIPDRIAWLVENGVEFYQKDIFNIENLLQDVDIVIHTAGITAVPQTKEQSNTEIDNKITYVGTEGTRKIISEVNKKCKFIFLSTHVVYEGLKSSVLSISESFEPQPSLAYAMSKRQSELDLINSDLDFLILRLASVYGYNRGVRISILPNLFAKLTSQNQNLKVFGANNLKPFIGINDVVRSIDHLISSDYHREIFHLANEALTVKTIAHICQTYKNIDINVTDDIVPNQGYSLSNNKLKSSNFHFKQNINAEIGKMIKIWSNK